MAEQTDRLEKMLIEIDRDYYSHDRSKLMAKLAAEQALALARIADTVGSLELLDAGLSYQEYTKKLAEL